MKFVDKKTIERILENYEYLPYMYGDNLDEIENNLKRNNTLLYNLIVEKASSYADEGDFPDVLIPTLFMCYVLDKVYFSLPRFTKEQIEDTALKIGDKPSELVEEEAFNNLQENNQCLYDTLMNKIYPQVLNMKYWENYSEEKQKRFESASFSTLKFTYAVLDGLLSRLGKK